MGVSPIGRQGRGRGPLGLYSGISAKNMRTLNTGLEAPFYPVLLFPGALFPLLARGGPERWKGARQVTLLVLLQPSPTPLPL